MRSKYLNIMASLIALYFFVSGIMIIKNAAEIMGEDLAEKIILIIRDTTSAVFAGWIGTALLHSSGAFDSIIVTFTASGVLPMNLAVATVIGAELGTTVTPFLVSVINQIRRKSGQKAAFNVTLSHVIYNLITLLIFYLAEVFFHLFSRISEIGSRLFINANWLYYIPDLLEVATPWVKPLFKNIPPWVGLILGIILLIIALGGIEKYMTEVFNMPRSWNLIRATFTKPLRAFFAGLIFAILVPSTTVMVSLLVPLASSGVISADYYILPYILGANIGTVFDVMIAAMATGNPIAMGVWLVHLSINLIGAMMFLPLLKPFSDLIKSIAGIIAESPKTTLITTVLFHLIPILILLIYSFNIT
ncbi:Na/Pi cotransporter family protein [Candidatus Bathyarchaeota archaeon]|nr:Na/Pi cotransporter family protein [Candidatus Bathyarchaeota archaeon]